MLSMREPSAHNVLSLQMVLLLNFLQPPSNWAAFKSLEQRTLMKLVECVSADTEKCRIGWIERSYAREGQWEETKKQVMNVC